jgi:hypothetical protein
MPRYARMSAVSPRHKLLAALTFMVRGLAFVATEFGLDSFSAPN